MEAKNNRIFAFCSTKRSKEIRPNDQDQRSNEIRENKIRSIKVFPSEIRLKAI